MIIKTIRTPFSRALYTNSTDASFTDKIATLTEPTGIGVVSWDDKDGDVISNSLLLMPFGVGAENTTFKMRVWGWRYCGFPKRTGIIVKASNDNPIKIRTPNHNLATGALVTITGVVGNTAANVTASAITVQDNDNFTLDGVAGNGAYDGGGVWTVPFRVWIPLLLIETVCTLSAKLGVATGEVDNTNRLVDIIVQTTGYGSTPGISNEIVSPANDLPGSIVLDTKGLTKAEFVFNMNSSATSANCMVGRL